MAIHHVNRPDYSFYFGTNEDQYLRFVFHGLASFGLKKTPLALQPNLVYMRQGPLQESLMGVTVRYKQAASDDGSEFSQNTAFSLGGHFRLGDAFIPSMLLEYGKFALGISYDVNISDLKMASSKKGGIEITFRYSHPNPFKEDKYKPRSLF